MNDADARLIAAARDLYEALRELVAFCDDERRYDAIFRHGPISGLETLVAAHNALKKVDDRE